MTSFYKRAVFLPVAIPIVAALVASMFNGRRVEPDGFLYTFVDTLLFIAVAGAVGLIPYALYIGVVLSSIRPTSGQEARRLSWLAPSMIAFPFALAVALLMPMMPGGMRGRVNSFYIFGLLALGVGYGYVLIIEIALRVGRKLGWISTADVSA
jgi:hypothetical protein